MSSTRAANAASTTPFTVNGHTYHPPPKPVVVVCIDGCADEYLSTALARGRMPRLAELARGGWRGMVRGALPSFTNVNNAAIIAGAPPAVTGIPGNFFLDPETGEEVMMNSASYLRCDTILAAAAKAGRRVAMVTAKDKLRNLLSRDLEGIAFSAEKADEATEATHGVGEVETLVGRPTPEVYSGDLSLFVLEAGAALLETGRADFLYLTLSDYVQHKHAPDEEPALAFHAALDAQLGRYVDAGAVLGITADHGMNGKTAADGTHNVIWLQSLLDEQFGAGNRVICPITDPYVVHHGALGGYVVVHLADPERAGEIGHWVLQRPGVTEVHDRQSAAQELELPADRLGDLIVMSARDHVIGKRPEDHDLSLLGGRLRSHGGRYAEMVPMILSIPLDAERRNHMQGDPRSFELYSLLLAGVPA